MNCCYILHSKALDSFYTGASHDDLSQRIEKHNSAFYGSGHFTSQADDWQVFLTIECETYAQAINIERHIKKMKSRVYIRNLKTFPEMVEKLKSKYTSGSTGLSR